MPLGTPTAELVQSGEPAARCPLSMPLHSPRPQDSSARVVKLQILAAVFLPMLALGLWLRSQGFW